MGNIPHDVVHPPRCCSDVLDPDDHTRVKFYAVAQRKITVSVIIDVKVSEMMSTRSGLFLQGQGVCA